MAEGPAPGSGRGEDPAGRGTPDGTLETGITRAGRVRAGRVQAGPHDPRAGPRGGSPRPGSGVIRALIRRRARPGYAPARPGGLPGAWQEGLTQEVPNQLGVTLRAADALTGLAADLDTRLTLTGRRWRQG